MSKFNADEQSLYSPIEVRIGGKDYKVITVTPNVMDKIASVIEDSQKSEDLHKIFNAASEQLSIYLNVPATVFEDVPMPRIVAAVNYIVKSLTDGAQAEASEETKKLDGNRKK